MDRTKNKITDYISTDEIRYQTRYFYLECIKNSYN